MVKRLRVGYTLKKKLIKMFVYTNSFLDNYKKDTTNRTQPIHKRTVVKSTSVKKVKSKKLNKNNKLFLKSLGLKVLK